MNTRIQVEHPVTEMVTGVDLVKEQIRIAAGEPVGVAGETLAPRGHAIECRICAEDPDTLAPCAGKITEFSVAGGAGLRVDRAASAESFILLSYDSLMAKLVVHGANPTESISSMAR